MAAAAIKTERWPSVDIAVVYESDEGKQYRATFPLHLEDLKGVLMIDEQLPPERIAKGLDKLAKHVEKIESFLDPTKG